MLVEEKDREPRVVLSAAVPRAPRLSPKRSAQSHYGFANVMNGDFVAEPVTTTEKSREAQITCVDVTTITDLVRF
jgi:hypothetical protein